MVLWTILGMILVCASVSGTLCMLVSMMNSESSVQG